MALSRSTPSDLRPKKDIVPQIKVSFEDLLKDTKPNTRVKLCDENRFFQIEAKQCRFRQRDAKIVVVQETTQEIEINES